jgi:hypothetical protein
VIDVGATHGLLWRHVLGATQHRTRVGDGGTTGRGGARHLRDTEIEQLGLYRVADVGDEHVVGLDVSMNDAARVSEGQGFGHRQQQLHGVHGR